MKETIDLYDAVIVTDELFCDLSQVNSAMTIILEGLEDGLCSPEKIDAEFAKNFTSRFPMYYDALNLLHSRLLEIAQDAAKGADKFLEAHKRHEEAKA